MEFKRNMLLGSRRVCGSLVKDFSSASTSQRTGLCQIWRLAAESQVELSPGSTKQPTLWALVSVRKGLD